jgi:hypothetical protein
VWKGFGNCLFWKDLQTIIGKCIKPAINLLYWRGSPVGPMLNRLFPIWASYWKGWAAERDVSVRGRHQERERTRGKQKGGNWARSPETKPLMIETKAPGDVEKESWLSKKLLWKRNFQWLYKGGWWGDMRRWVHQKNLIWAACSCLLSSLALIRLPPPQHRF